MEAGVIAVIIVWIIVASLVGAVGANRQIGFWGAFLVSLFITPIIGIIVTYATVSDEEMVLKKEQIKLLKEIRDNLKEK